MRLNRSLSALLPLLVCAVSLGITGWLWTHERRVAERTLKAEFDFGVRQTASRIEQRMASYEQMLRGVQGLFRAADPVDRDRFDAYVDALRVGADFAGIQSFAYARLTPGGGEASATVTHIAPATPMTLQALGGDPYADPVRRVAMLLARDSGSLGITPRVSARVDPGRAQSDFLMFLPVYARGEPVDRVAARRAALPAGCSPGFAWAT